MNDHQIQLESVEAFLRRASKVDMPFMVKGSIITRQYMPDPNMRYVADLDWVYLKNLDSDDNAGKIFSDWAIEVTETIANDQVKYRSFKENDFWRRIDYAMHDDFPTVNTDLLCYVNGQMNDRLTLDISYNLDIDFPPVPLEYKPMHGAPFNLKYTCPLSLQVSWKLHQLLVRPRLKDVFDLIYLLQHEKFDQTIFDQTVFALKKECERDHIDIKKLIWYVDGRMAEYLGLQELDRKYSLRWKYLNFIIPKFECLNLLRITDAKHFAPENYFIYKNLSDIFRTFRNVLIAKGFTGKFISKL